MKKPPEFNKLKRFRVFYLSLAALVLNSLLFLVFVNLGLVLAYKLKRTIYPFDGFNSELSDKFTPTGAPVPNGKRSTEYQVEVFDKFAFEGAATDREIGEMLDESHDLALQPGSYLGLGLHNYPEFQGKHIRLLTDEVGVRFRWTPSVERRKNESGPAKKEIYVFGGSTTYGIHVADIHTWPAYLDEMLNESTQTKGANLRNYGRGGYDLSTKTALLLLLIQRGQRPDLVIFFDGGNEHSILMGENFGSKDLEQLVQNAFSPRSASVFDLPLIKSSGFMMFAQSLGMGRLQKKIEPDAMWIPPMDKPENEVEKDAQKLADNYLKAKTNIAALAAANGIRTLFFLEPDATYNYSPALYRKPPALITNYIRKLKGRFYEKVQAKTNSIYLGDLFKQWGHRKAIVDDCHYSPGFAKFVASKVANRLWTDNVLGETTNPTHSQSATDR